MLQRLAIVYGQVKLGYVFEILLKEIRKTIYSLHRASQIPKEVYVNKMTSIPL